MRTPLLLLIFSFSVSVSSQSLCRIHGADVYVGAGLDVYIGGAFLNDSTSRLENKGNVSVVGDFINNGQFIHAGQLSLRGNWINNSVFDAQTNSAVHFDGSNQTIEGDSISGFGQLKLVGSGSILLRQHCHTHTLFLFDRVLLTDSFRMKVTFSDVSSIQRTTGFVMSERKGNLVRAVLAGETYLFPVGRGLIYSPVEVTPSEQANDLGVRLANVDASSEDLSRTQVDTNICRSNADFYHLISGGLGVGSQVSFQVDSLKSVEFPFLAVRNVGQNSVWSQFATLPTEFNGLSATIKFIAQSTHPELAYLMVRNRPLRPLILGDTAFCQRSENTQFQLNQSLDLTTNWGCASGEIIEESDSTITVNWGNQQSGLISAIQTDNVGCSSFASNHTITLWPLPQASFAVLAPDFLYENQLFTLTNTSEGSTGQTWNISGNTSYTDSLISIRFDSPGIYSAVLTAINEFGCIDTSSREIEIVEGMEFPNSFSPNGDGVNDELVFLNSGIQWSNIQIFDRWGNSVFESKSPKLSWDGRTSSGELVNAGTYYVVVLASSMKKTYEKQFPVTVFY